jgi:hypothetical protein
MCDERRGSDADELEVPLRYAVEDALAGAEGNRCDLGVQLIDEAGGEILIDCGGSTGDGNVTITGSSALGRERSRPRR